MSRGTPPRGKRALREPSSDTGTGPSFADIAADYCRRKFPRGSTETKNSNNACSFEKRERFSISLEEFWVSSTLPQNKEQRGKISCPLTARGSLGKAMKGLVSGAAAGSAECRRHWTAALISRSSAQGTHPSNTERAHATQAAWNGGRYKAARNAKIEQGRSTTKVKLSPKRSDPSR